MGRNILQNAANTLPHMIMSERYFANPWSLAGAIREAIAPYGRYNAASSPKVQSTGYLDTIQNKAAVALPTPMSAGSPGVPPRVSQNQVYISMT